jgi:hypothetical protein
MSVAQLRPPYLLLLPAMGALKLESIKELSEASSRSGGCRTCQSITARSQTYLPGYRNAKGYKRNRKGI